MIWIEHTTIRTSCWSEAKSSPTRNVIYNNNVAVILQLQVSAICRAWIPIAHGCPGSTVNTVNQKCRALHVEASDQVSVNVVIHLGVRHGAICHPDWDAVIVETQVTISLQNQLVLFAWGLEILPHQHTVTWGQDRAAIIGTVKEDNAKATIGHFFTY